MARPVIGWLGYDEANDRPTVKLQSGTKRLLTQDDAGGGGSVTELDSPDGSLTITNGTGPVISADVNETELENGGSHELNVAGLSGVLADPQIAGSLDTTGAAVDVSAAAPPTAGQVLTATSATTASWSLPAPKHFPAPGSVDDEDFNGTPGAIPAGWNLYRPNSGSSIYSSAAVLSTNQPTVGIDPFNAVAESGNDGSLVLVDVNSARNSWFWYQPPQVNVNIGRFAFMKALAGGPNTDESYLCRYQLYAAQGGSITNADGRFALIICADDGGVPDIQNNRTRIAIGWYNTGTTGLTVQASATFSGGTTSGTNYVLHATTFKVPHPAGEYLYWAKRGTDWYAYIGDYGGAWVQIGAFGSQSWTPGWWGWVADANSTVPGSETASLVGVDHLWRYESAVPLI